MTEMQVKLLEMLSWLTDYLERHNIIYYIVGGTMLGAIRHKGFIPWDDDIDIALPRDEYNKLILGFNNNGEKYVLETPYDNNSDYLYTYSKLYDSTTTLIERQRHNIKRGIYIDIFPLDGLGNSVEDAKKMFKVVNKKNCFLMTQTCAIRKQRKVIKNMAILVSRSIPFFNIKKYSLKVDKFASQKQYDASKYIANLSGSYGEKEIVDKCLFGNPTNYSFENIIVKGPEFGEKYLSQLYNDWMILPPLEKRGVQHDFVYVDLNKSYFE